MNGLVVENFLKAFEKISRAFEITCQNVLIIEVRSVHFFEHHFLVQSLGRKCSFAIPELLINLQCIGLRLHFCIENFRQLTTIYCKSLHSAAISHHCGNNITIMQLKVAKLMNITRHVYNML